MGRGLTFPVWRSYLSSVDLLEAEFGADELWVEVAHLGGTPVVRTLFSAHCCEAEQGRRCAIPVLGRHGN